MRRHQSMRNGGDLRVAANTNNTILAGLTWPVFWIEEPRRQPEKADCECLTNAGVVRSKHMESGFQRKRLQRGSPKSVASYTQIRGEVGYVERQCVVARERKRSGERNSSTNARAVWESSFCGRLCSAMDVRLGSESAVVGSLLKTFGGSGGNSSM